MAADESNRPRCGQRERGGPRDCARTIVRSALVGASCRMRAHFARFAQQLIIEAACPPGAFRRLPQYRPILLARNCSKLQLQITGASVLRRIKSSKAAVSDSSTSLVWNCRPAAFAFWDSRWAFRKNARSSLGQTMAMLNCKIAPFVFWLCFLALSFFTTFNGQSQSARTSSRDRPEPAKPLCQEGPRGARGPLSGRAAENGLSPAGDDARAASPPRENQDRRSGPHARSSGRRAASLNNLSRRDMQQMLPYLDQNLASLTLRKVKKWTLLWRRSQTS